MLGETGILIFVHMFYSSLWRTSLDVGLPVQNRNLFKPLQDCHPKCFTIYTPQGSAQKCFQGSRQPWVLLLVKIWSLWWWQIILINVVAWLLGSWIIYCKIIICSFFYCKMLLCPLYWAELMTSEHLTTARKQVPPRPVEASTLFPVSSSLEGLYHALLPLCG